MSNIRKNVSWARLIEQFNRTGVADSAALRLRFNGVAQRLSALLSGTTAPDPPAAPADFTATSPAPGRVELSWTAEAAAEDYVVFRDIATGPGAIAGTTVATSYTFTNLSAGLYRFEVASRNTAGTGPRSGSITVEVTEVTAPPSTPDSVTGLAVVGDATVDGVTLTWDAFTGGTVTARLERSVDGANFEALADGLGSAGTLVDSRNLTAGLTNSYRIIGINEAGIESAPSAAVDVVIGSVAGDTTPPPVPEMATILSGGISVANAQIYATCEPVFAADLAGYQFGISTTDDPATAEWGATVSANHSYIIEHNGSRVLSGTTYYVWARSVDSTVPANVSDASSAALETLIVLTLSVDGPFKPSNLLGESPAPGTVNFSWGLGVNSGPISNFQIYQSVDGGPEELVSEPDANDREATINNLDVDTAYTFRMRSEGITGTFSAYTEELTLFAAGQDATGGGVGQGQGPYDGETAFGSDYIVPGETLDYVVDLREYTGTFNSVAEAFGILEMRTTAYPEGHPFYIPLPGINEDPVRVAVLLPDRVETRPLNISRLGVNGMDRAAPEWMRGSAIELHLVGSAVSALGDAVSDSENVRDNGSTLEFGYIYAPDASELEDSLVLDLAMERGTTALHLHNWSIEPDAQSANSVRLGRTEASVGGNTALVSGRNEVFLHNSRVLFGMDSTGGQQGIRSYMTRLNLDGVYMDLPHIQGHAILMDLVPNGDMGWTRTNIYRAGGSFAVFADTGFNFPLEAAETGTLTISDWVCPDAWGSRFSLASGALFRHMGMHQKIRIANSDFVSTRVSGATRGSWNNFNVLAENIGDGNFTGSVPLVSMTPRAEAGIPVTLNANGLLSDGLELDGVRFFSEDPRISIVDARAADVINIRNSVLLNNDGGTIDIASGGTGAVDYLFSNFIMLNNNLTADVAQFESDYSIAASQLPTVIAGSNDVAIGDGVDTFQWTQFEGPEWVEYQDPTTGATIPGDPSGGGGGGGAGEIPVLQAWDLKDNPIATNKTIRMGLLRSTRETRTTGELPFIRVWSEGYPLYPQYSELAQFDDGAGTIVSFHATETSGQTGLPPEFGGSGSFASLYSPSFMELSNDGKTISVSDVDWQYDVSYTDKDTLHMSGGGSYTNVADEDATHPAQGRRPVGGELLMTNIGIDYQNLDNEGNNPKWCSRMYNIPNIVWENCDFSNNANEHGTYLNTYEDFTARGCTYYQMGSQGIQLTSRASGVGGESEVNNGPIEASTNTLVEDCHFIDCTAAHAGRGGTRSATTATLSNRGTVQFPARIEVKDSTFVCAVEDAGVGEVGYGSGVRAGAQSMGCIVTGFEKGLASFTDPSDSTRAGGVAQLHSEIILSNVLFHRVNPGRTAVSLRSAECITIENCVWVNDYVGNDPGSVQYNNPLNIDENTSNIRDEPTLRSRYLLVRNNYAPSENVGGALNYMGESNRSNAINSGQIGLIDVDLHCPDEEIVYDLWSTDDIGFGPGVLYRGAIRPEFSLTPTT